MRELKEALAPVKRRMRAQRVFLWAAYGLLAGAVCIVLIRLASFLFPFENAVWWGAAAAAAGPALFALAALCLPVKDVNAARQADALGLMARAQTALMLQGDDTPMAQMQRQDTIESLRSIEPKRMLRFRAPALVWAGVAVCLALTGLSFLISNPQAQVLQAREQFRKDMTAQADKVDQATDNLDEKQTQTPETRKLLKELSQNLRDAQQRRDALEAVDQTERRIEKMQQRTASQALDAMKNAGLDSLAAALENQDTAAVQEALEQTDAADRLNQAAQQAGDVGDMLASASQSLKAGDLQQAMQLLQNASKGQSMSAAQAMALAAMARAAAAQSGQGSQMGQGSGTGSSASQGKDGKGGGASLGSSDKDGGVSGKNPIRQQPGSADPEKKTAEYESIYDPTRLGGAGDAVSDSGEMGQGDVQEVEIGSGTGSLNGSVPYSQAITQYSQAEVQAVQNAALPAYAQRWVQDYFNALQ